VVVVVASVLGVPVPVVQVVDVVIVRDRDVPASLAVPVSVTGVLDMPGWHALVGVTFVGPVQVPVVDVIGMAVVRDGDVPAALAVDMLMAGVLGMRLRAHEMVSLSAEQRPRCPPTPVAPRRCR
jgi:hypothetical protein